MNETRRLALLENSSILNESDDFEPPKTIRYNPLKDARKAKPSKIKKMVSVKKQGPSEVDVSYRSIDLSHPSFVILVSGHCAVQLQEPQEE